MERRPFAIGDMFNYAMGILTEAIVKSHNSKAMTLVKKIISYLENMKEKEKKDITKDVMNVAFFMKPQIEIALKRYKGKIILTRSKKIDIAGCFPLDNNIDVVVNYEEAKKRGFDPIRHEASHIIIIIQHILKSRNGVSLPIKNYETEIDYLTNLYEVEQVLSKFIENFDRKKDRFKKYKGFLWNLYYEYKPTEEIIDKLVKNGKLKNYILKRLYREGIRVGDLWGKENGN